MTTLNFKQIHALADLCPFDFLGMARHLAEGDDYGFLGSGGDLDVSTLLHAYRSGVFPWFGQDEPIQWWSPNPRCVIKPADFLPKKSLVRTAKKQSWTLTTNQAFVQVIKACSQPRAYADDTWITATMQQAYTKLHELGVAISIEVWQDEPCQSELVGGLYGVQMGKVFCGESMFHHQTDASKIAFWGLMVLCQKCGIKLVDCQLENEHLMSLGAELMERKEFLTQLLHNSRQQDGVLSLTAPTKARQLLNV